MQTETMTTFDAAKARYEKGEYDSNFGDGRFKAGQMACVIDRIPDLHTIHTYADIGCGDGTVFACLWERLLE